MNNMFDGASLFESDLSNWDVSNVTDMSRMFANTNVFDSNLSRWDVSNVTDMSYMFYGNALFDQDLGDWNVTRVTSMEEIFVYTKLSTQNYNAILTKWSQLRLQNGVIFDVGDTQYSLEVDDKRQSIINSFNWTINDGGVADE